MGIRKNEFMRDLVRVIVANMLAAQKEWAEVVKEVGAHVVDAVNLIWTNKQRFPNISYDRVPAERVKELMDKSEATASDRSLVPQYLIRYLKAGKMTYGFEVTPTDEKALINLLSDVTSKENMMKDLYTYLNRVQIKREYDRVYATGAHQRVRLASQKNPVFVYGVVLKYLDSLDRGF